MQSSVKMILFYLPPQYKYLQPQRKQDKQYWNEIAIAFLEKKHNANMNMIRKGFPIKIFLGGSPHECYKTRVQTDFG